MWLGDSPLSKDDEWASAEVSTAKFFPGIGELLKGRSGCDVMRGSRGVFIKRHSILMGSCGKFDSVQAWNRNGTEKGGRRGVPLPPERKTDFKEEMGTERVFRTDLAQLASNQFWEFKEMFQACYCILYGALWNPARLKSYLAHQRLFADKCSSLPWKKEFQLIPNKHNHRFCFYWSTQQFLPTPLGLH